MSPPSNHLTSARDTYTPFPPFPQVLPPMTITIIDVADIDLNKFHLTMEFPSTQIVKQLNGQSDRGGTTILRLQSLKS